MVLFTKDELAGFRLRLKKDDSALNQLRLSLNGISEKDLMIPTSGVATWGHYFACPNDGAHLKFVYGQDHDFCCPVCKSVYNGEPYYGAWWRLMNGASSAYAYFAALLWVLNNESEYLSLSKRILIKYADNYPNYEEHGDIPYNKQGKMNSQIICESSCLQALAMAYDLIKEDLDADDRAHIENDLLILGAKQLIKNRSPQIHNHEVIVDAGIGIIGLALENDEYVDFAVNGKYGLIYQLEHGVLKDGLWFEGSFNYHYYALLSFIQYEKMACGTKYSLAGREEFLRMYKLPLKLLQPDYSLPRLGDNGSENYFAGFPSHYEFIYKLYGLSEFATILNKVYETYPRDPVEALLFGKETIEPVEIGKLDDYHNEDGSGISILRGSDHRQYLLFRHAPYGGEHDHYDKLALHYAYGKYNVMPDLGTVSYGLKPHYGYFKNTVTHNTVSINAQNQPPCNAYTARFVKGNNFTLTEARADWTKPAALPDSFIIKQWDDKAYAGVKMARTVLFTDEYFIEVFRVLGAKARDAYWVSHPKGDCTEAANDMREYVLTGSEPLTYFKNARGFLSDEPVMSEWRSNAGRFQICSACNVIADVIYAEAPDNPMQGDLTYLIRRVSNATDDVIFAAVYCLNLKGSIENPAIEFFDGGANISFDFAGDKIRHVSHTLTAWND